MSGPPKNPVDLSFRRKVLIVDDFPVVRESLAKCLDGEGDLFVCGEARTFAETINALAEHKPDVIVLELALRDGDGVKLITQIRAIQKSVPIVVFTTLDESTHALRVLQAGGQGFVGKQEPTERLMGAIRAVLKGGYAISPQVSTRFLQSALHSTTKSSATPASLGEQELKVFELLGRGTGTREIATQLGLSIKTVETYRARIKEKLHLPDASAMVREAVRWIKHRTEEQQKPPI